MNRLFLRFFTLVMLSISVATIAIYLVISMFFGDPFDEVAEQQASGQILLLSEYVDQAGPDEWLPRLNKLREITHARFDLIPLQTAKETLNASRQAQLLRGEVVINVADKSFYRRVDLKGERYIGSDEDVILAQDLPIDVAPVLKTEVLRYIIVAVCLLIPIALWSSSHWRGLQALEKVADEFGAGHLKVRAQTSERDSIHPLAQRMNQMAERIEELLDAQRNLLHSVSHELRTPIARLEFALELLRNAAKNPLLEPRLQAMGADITELNTMVSELLDLGKLDQAAPLQASEFSLGTCLQDCVDGLQHVLQEHQVKTVLPADLGMMVGDPRLLARAVSNLLRNAAKYTNDSIWLSACRIPGVGMEISLEDDGPGIPEDERERIFEPFYRLDRSRDRNTGGFGLGLAIAQKAVQAHGGRISVAQGEYGGARFTIFLPAGLATN
ncbi:ATP-binding protein [Undibacterium sp. TS12]|uniref:ATP-binding protein n=1 Tax=Undibacterium sp. TS12 TaxID=2908202 RepID=UPI001F4CBA5A|nr:ATP-binding protein [Undibacterium sp. TS12]MCH8620835.1 ATP-binding protein [Undibacterium sp. TS12]